MLAEAGIYSRLDANMGFLKKKNPLIEDSAKLTTFIAPFGIASAPEHFQNKWGAWGSRRSHIRYPDVRSYSRGAWRLPARCSGGDPEGRHCSLKKKCDLSRSEVGFLGHVVSRQGLSRCIVMHLHCLEDCYSKNGMRIGAYMALGLWEVLHLLGQHFRWRRSKSLFWISWVLKHWMLFPQMSRAPVNHGLAQRCLKTQASALAEQWTTCLLMWRCWETSFRRSVCVCVMLLQSGWSEVVSSWPLHKQQWQGKTGRNAGPGP